MQFRIKGVTHLGDGVAARAGDDRTAKPAVPLSTEPFALQYKPSSRAARHGDEDGYIRCYKKDMSRRITISVRGSMNFSTSRRSWRRPKGRIRDNHEEVCFIIHHSEALTKSSIIVLIIPNCAMIDRHARTYGAHCLKHLIQILVET